MTAGVASVALEVGQCPGCGLPGAFLFHGSPRENGGCEAVCCWCALAFRTAIIFAYRRAPRWGAVVDGQVWGRPWRGCRPVVAIGAGGVLPPAFLEVGGPGGSHLLAELGELAGTSAPAAGGGGPPGGLGRGGRAG